MVSTRHRTVRRFSRTERRRIPEIWTRRTRSSPKTGIGTTIASISTGGFGPSGALERYGVTEPSLVVSTQIPHDYQFYLEYVYVSKIAPNANGRAFTDFGVQKLLGRRTEVDVEYGHSLIGDPRLSFQYIGAGMVVQLP